MLRPVNNGFNMTHLMNLDMEVSGINPAAVATHRVSVRPDYSFSQVPCLCTLMRQASHAAPLRFDNPGLRL